MTQVCGEIVPGSSEMFASLIHSEYLRYAKLVKDANISPTDFFGLYNNSADQGIR